MSIINIPNTLTLLRIILVPVFVMALIYGRYSVAFAIFLIATLTDCLDGMIARRTGQKTPLGAFLDPLADKSILMTSFIIFAYLNWIPKWLTIVVISRDLIVVFGWILLYIIYGAVKVDVTYTGKLAIASQFILIVYTLASINFSIIPKPSLWLYILVGLLTTYSGLHYIYRGLRYDRAQGG